MGYDQSNSGIISKEYAKEFLDEIYTIINPERAVYYMQYQNDYDHFSRVFDLIDENKKRYLDKEGMSQLIKEMFSATVDLVAQKKRSST